jgi:type IV pilus assembly protein PilN
MRIDINLATQRYEDARSFWWRWGLPLAGLGVLTLVLLYSVLHGWAAAQRARGLVRKGEQQIAALDRQKADAEAILNRPENRSTRDRSQFLNDLFQRKAFSWTRVFEDMERVMPPRLHVVSIQPEMTSDKQLAIKLVVAGESRERALDLVRRMEDSQRFRKTHIESETTQSGQGTGDNVRFDINALYIPETAGRRGSP